MGRHHRIQRPDLGAVHKVQLLLPRCNLDLESRDLQAEELPYDYKDLRQAWVDLVSQVVRPLASQVEVQVDHQASLQQGFHHLEALQVSDPYRAVH